MFGRATGQCGEMLARFRAIYLKENLNRPQSAQRVTARRTLSSLEQIVGPPAGFRAGVSSDESTKGLVNHRTKLAQFASGGLPCIEIRVVQIGYQLRQSFRVRRTHGRQLFAEERDNC